MTEILSGRELSARIRSRAAQDAQRLIGGGIQPRLAIVMSTTGEAAGKVDESAEWYVKSIVSAAAKVSISAEVTTADPDRLPAAIAGAAADPLVHGIIVQTPLPQGVSLARLGALVPPEKDVDGVNPLSAGRLMLGEPAFAPATAAAVLELLDHHQVALSGRHAVVVGRSAVVGKPVAQLLLARDATVTTAHSRTRDLPAITRTAEILVVAVGRAGFLRADGVDPHAVVIDVGTNTDADGRLVGDVDAGSVQDHAAALSPVPGGVGPVTTAVLLAHTVAAAENTAHVRA